MNVLLEGFWGVGKSTLLDFLKNSYEIIFEPHHQENITITDQQEISQWYAIEHLKRFQDFVNHKDNQIIERSILSSLAYEYMKENVHYSQEMLQGIKEIQEYKHSHDLPVIVLYSEYDYLPDTVKSLYSKEVFDRYMEFFRVRLPLDFGIVPTFIKVHDSEGNHLSEQKILELIQLIHTHDRVCQVNIVCYRMNNKLPEFLVLQRNPQKGSFWQSITGGVHMKGLLQENALRELQEELSIHGKTERLLPTDYVFWYVGGEGYELTEYVFGYEITSEDTVTLSDEHVDQDYLSADEAVERVKYDGNKNAIQAVYSKIVK